jgi:hypothetical protein
MARHVAVVCIIPVFVRRRSEALPRRDGPRRSGLGLQRMRVSERARTRRVPVDTPPRDVHSAQNARGYSQMR